MAPAEQIEVPMVPMVMWLSDSFAHDYKVDRAALSAAASTKVTHENLYHTIIGLLQVSSTTKRDEFDLLKK